MAAARLYDRMVSNSGLDLEEEHFDENECFHQERWEDGDLVVKSTRRSTRPQLQQKESGGDGNTMNMLASYYGLVGEEEATRDEIDQADFQMQAHVRQLLKHDDLEALLRRDDELVQEVKRLDSDMQMLVYENYSKFVSATDTIRVMKNNVNDMKAEMDSLAKNMEGIASRMQVVNSFLGGKRAKVDKLVSVRRLLKRLDFLFDLPINLNRCVQRQDFAMAVTCYVKTINILEEHSHVPSFKSIQRESDQIMAGVRDELQRRVRQPTDDGFPTSPAELALYVRLLLELGVPKEGLKTQMLSAYNARFGKMLAALQKKDEERRAKKTSNGEEGGGAGAEAVAETVKRWEKEFVQDLEEALTLFRELFPSVNDVDDTSVTNKSREDDAELTELMRTLVSRHYLVSVRRLFQANLALIARSPRGDGHEFPVLALSIFLRVVRRLHRAGRGAGVLDAGVRLVLDVVRALVFLEVRGLQGLALRRLLALQARQAASLSSAAPSFAPRHELETFQTSTTRELARALEALQGVVQGVEEGIRAALLEAGEVASHASPLSGSGMKASGPAREGVLYSEPLIPELGMGQYVFQFVAWLSDAVERVAGVPFRLTENDLVEVGEVRRSVFPERFFAHVSSFTSLLGSGQVEELGYPSSAVASTALPQFALLLAVLCRDLQSSLWPQAMATLALVFPATMSTSEGGNLCEGEGNGRNSGYVDEGTSSTSGGLNRLSPEDVVACLKGSSSRLLQHCTETLGHDLALLSQTRGLDLASVAVGGLEVAGSVGGVTQATWGKTFIVRMEALIKEVGATLGVSVAGVGLSGGRRGERADLSRTPGPFSGIKGLHLDIERIFTAKVQDFGSPLGLTLDQILLGTLKAACKAVIEWTRQDTMSQRTYCQLMVDVHLVRQAVGTYVKDARVVETLLDEVLISAGERTAADGLQGVDPLALSALASAEYSRLRTSMLSSSASSSAEASVLSPSSATASSVRR